MISIIVQWKKVPPNKYSSRYMNDELVGMTTNSDDNGGVKNMIRVLSEIKNIGIRLLKSVMMSEYVLIVT
jgi:hypothetical protein